MSLFAELKRRSVFRVAIGYIGISWLVIQVVETLFGIYEIDEGNAQIIVNVLAIGFIPAIVLAWVFEWTPEGIKRDADTDHNTKAMRAFGRRVDRIIIAILSVAVIYFAVDKFWPTETAGPSIAVMPFENVSGDPAQDPFAEGITNQMRSMLNSVRELRVIAEYSVNTLIEEGVDRSAMARELNLTHFLEGSIQAMGDKVRVTATLVNVTEGTQDWSATFDRDMDDIFAIQDEISSEVIGQLNFGDASPAAPISRKVDFEAYKLYLRANHLNTFGVDDGSSEDAARLALELLEQAVAIDPAFIDAWLELSLASYRLWRYEGKPPESPMLARSDEAIEHARRLDAEHPVLLAYEAGGAFLEGQGDTQTIASQLEKAIEAAPTNPDVIRASRQFAASIGRVDSAVAMAELAVDRDPRCALCWYVLSQALRDAGRNTEAEDAGKMALSLGMNLEFSIATTQLYQHNPDGMLARFTNDRPDNAQGLWAYAMALHTAGRSEEFESVFAELRDNFADDAPLEIAMVYAWSGNTDAAFAWLGRAAESKLADLQTRYRSPFLFSLRSDPRWQELLRRIGRHPEQLAKIRFDPDIPEVQR